MAKCSKNSKRRLEAQGILCKERLVFHGTPHHKIFECARFAHGYGIYFSKFPDISQVYGQHLLLRCFLVGRHYNEGWDKAGTGYNSKFVAPDKDGKAQMIMTDKEDHIFFIFNIPR